MWKLFPGFFLSIGGYGALTGERRGFFVEGYGAGYNFKVLDFFGFEAGLFFGGGGGGAVHIGSGFLLKPSIGIRTPLWKNYILFMDAGYTYALNGYFGALSLEAGIIRDILPLKFEASDTGRLIPGYVQLDHWKILVLNKSFFPAKNAKLKNGTGMESVIQLAGFALYHPITRHLQPGMGV